MKLCGKCGAQMPDEALCCTNCGTPLEADPNSQQPPFEQQYYQQPYQQQGYYSQKNNKAIISLALGAGGLVVTLAAPFLAGVPAVVGLVMCIAGIVLGVKARNEIPEGHPDRGMATGGLVCAIIGTVIASAATLCTICVCSAAACLGATSLSSVLSQYTDIGIILFR